MTTIKLDRRFQDQVKGKLQVYNFEVGILNDKQRKSPKKGLKSFVGGVARKTGAISGITLSEASKDLREKTGINFYTRPFKSRMNKDINRLLKNFFDYAFGRSTQKRLTNTLQAVVRNPITRGDYGVNNPLTAKIKGFNRLMIDTGQLFKNIKARVLKIK